jgi:hypothetical protein
LVSYSTDLSDMRACKYTLVGKLLKAATYKDALVVRPGDVHQHRYGCCALLRAGVNCCADYVF